MTAQTVFPLAIWREGTTENAPPANENTVHVQAAFGRAIGFSDAAPAGPAEFDQYVVRTAWGGFAVNSIAVYVAGAWQEFATFDGMSKIINGSRYVREAGAWKLLVDWVDVPATSTSTGVPGQVARDFDTLYLYLCVAANAWKRVHLTTDVAPPPPPPPLPTPALLLDYEGVSIVDRGPNGLTVNGHGTAITTEFKRFGASGLSINGSYVSVIDNSLIVGTQDFTVDLWIYPTSVGSERFIMDSRNNGNTDNGFDIIYRAGGTMVFSDGAHELATNDVGQSGLTLVANQWQHVEVGRSSDTVYLFLNGQLAAKSTTGAYPNQFNSPAFIFHAAQYYPPGVQSMPGYADEVRVVIGTCAHTAAFTPPTHPYTY